MESSARTHVPVGPLRAALAGAERAALDCGGGWVGIPDLVFSLLAVREEHPALRRVHGLAAQVAPDLPRVDALRTSPGEPLPHSPRLAALVSSLDPGASIGELAERLLEDPWGPLWPAGQRPATDTPAAGFQLWLGPEDGRAVEPLPGDHLGRPSSSATPVHPLGVTRRSVDRAVSRRHLTWLGEGEVRVEATVWLDRAGSRRRVEAGESTLLRPDDLLYLSRMTILRVVDTGGLPPLGSYPPRR